MGHDALVGGQDDVAELTGGEHGGAEVLELVQLQVEAGRDHTALVEAAVQLNNDLASAGIVNHGELVDVAVLLHKTQDLDQHLGNGVQDDL